MIYPPICLFQRKITENNHPAGRQPLSGGVIVFKYYYSPTSSAIRSRIVTEALVQLIQ